MPQAKTIVTDCDSCGEIRCCTVECGGTICSTCDSLDGIEDMIPEPNHEDVRDDTRFNVWDDDEELFLDTIQSQLEAA